MRSWPTRPYKPVARIQIIPMVDVMMFLLVFFVLISIHVLPALGLKVALPHSSAAAKLDEPRRVTITITADGAIYLDGNATALEDLPGELHNLAAQSKVNVIIAGDERSALQTLVDVLGALQKGGVAATAITTRAK
ncbi:MAG TPA: biopolymer transporter ExbD [Steroidobacteraceae bacterium]|nr:biopolymer transporter ExbD [Steroidobacteraceae bacterium]